MAIATVWTDSALLRQPDDGRKYELVNGEVHEVPATVRHDEIGAIVIYRLMPFVIGRGILCSAQAGFRMQGGNLRSPDVSFVRANRLPDGKAPDSFGDGAPDLCVEILSPSEEAGDIDRKLREYFASGARLVWHLFPETQRILAFTSPTIRTIYEPDDELDAGDVLPGFRCRVEDLFRIA